jgi:2-(1,2-epoxy-1,2-dihydrophenyl)acetyl-CoA isomerase
MMGQTVHLKVSASMATVVLSRPEALNAIDVTMARELREQFLDLQSRDDIRVIVLTGAGRVFSAGADLKYIRRELDQGASAELILDGILKPLNETIQIIRRMPKLVIAAICGVASGGGFNLALACDYRLAAIGARFNQAFVRLGLAPDCGGTLFIPRIIGWARALEWMLSGDFIDAQQAEALGLVHRVVAEDSLLAEAESLAERLARGPTLALAAIKRLLEASSISSLDEQLEAERKTVSALSRTEDFREGIRAFSEKRPPRFQGR